MHIFFQVVEFIFAIGAIGSILVLALSFVDDIKTIVAAPPKHDSQSAVAFRAEQAKSGFAG